MKYTLEKIITLVLVTCFSVVMTTQLFAQEDDYVDELINRPTDRLAQTGMKFLSVSVDPRGASLGNAMTAVEQKSTAIFYNPAGMARIEGGDVFLGQTQFIADISYNAASAAYRTPIGVFAVSGVFVNYGDIERVVRADNEDGYLVDGSFSPTANAIGLGYARALTDRFSVGGQIKYVTQNLGTNATAFDDNGDYVYTSYKKNVMSYDFGILYNTGFRSLSIGMGLRNFSREITYAEFGFELPLAFSIGATVNVLNDFTNIDPNAHRLVLSLDTERPRDYYEQVKVGLEYTLMNTLDVRAGYVYPEDERGLNAGAGIHRNFGELGVSVDFAYTQFGAFSNVTRFSLGLTF